MQGAKNIFRQFHATSILKHVYRKQKDPLLLGEAESDWSGDQNDRKSKTGFHFKSGQYSAAFSRQFRQQQTGAFSSYEAEYQDLAAESEETPIFQQLLRGFQHPQQQPTSFDEGEQTDIKLSTNHVFHKARKVIDVKLLFLGCSAAK